MLIRINFKTNSSEKRLGWGRVEKHSMIIVKVIFPCYFPAKEPLLSTSQLFWKETGVGMCWKTLHDNCQSYIFWLLSCKRAIIIYFITEGALPSFDVEHYQETQYPSPNSMCCILRWLKRMLYSHFGWDLREGNFLHQQHCFRFMLLSSIFYFLLQGIKANN